MLRLILGAGAYTFYGFSYFFRRQTLRGGREMTLSKGEIHSQQQPNIQEQKKHLMSICVFFKCHEDTRSALRLSHIKEKYSMSHFSA